MPVQLHQAVIRQDREGEDHLVHLRLAVAAHGNDLVGNGVEHLYDALGRVVGREVVARPVVEKVAQKDDAVGTLGLDGGHEALAPVGGTVDVRRNDELHVGVLPCWRDTSIRAAWLRARRVLASMIRGLEGAAGRGGQRCRQRIRSTAARQQLAAQKRAYLPAISTYLQVDRRFGTMFCDSDPLLWTQNPKRH